MLLNTNDLAFMRATRRKGTPRGRPVGAKDQKRRKNSRYHWSAEDIAQKFTERFHIERTHPTMILTNNCWIWHGATTRGFGYMVVGSRQDNGGKSPRIQAHRLSYLIHKGTIAAKQLVGQTCKNKLCVNPIHLYLWRR